MQTDPYAGEQLCGSCGFVYAEKMEESGPEWRIRSDETDRSRVGAGTSLTMHDMGLSTIIGNTDKDASGNRLKSSMKSMVKQLRLWDSRTQAGSSSQRSLRQALNELIKLKSKLALTESIVEDAAYLYRKSMEKKLVQGHSTNGMMGACLYAACRNSETPRTFYDISSNLNVRYKDLLRCYRLLYRELELQTPIADPINYVSRVASLVNLSEKTKRKATDLIAKAKKLGIVAGKDPMGIAAAALYLSCLLVGEHRSQRAISEASGITEVTIRNRTIMFKRLLEN